jgi:hypothetical protein
MSLGERSNPPERRYLQVYVYEKNLRKLRTGKACCNTARTGGDGIAYAPYISTRHVAYRQHVHLVEISRATAIPGLL